MSNDVLAIRLRQLADWLQANPDVPSPLSVDLSVYTDVDTARKGMHLSGPWEKDTGDYYVTYAHKVSDSTDDIPVRFRLVINREQVCTRVQTGSRHIPAETLPARDEPIYEWNCS